MAAPGNRPRIGNFGGCLNQDRWRTIEALFAEVIAQPEEQRARLLETLTPHDEDLRQEVASLLACDRPNEPLQNIVQHAAATVFQTGDSEGMRLGNYRVIRKLGQGGMGTVYLAVRADDHYQQHVAIKLVSLGMETAEAVERFRRERQILASLEHPYIARLMDGGSAALEGFTHETPYFVMEYVVGEPVNEYCLRSQLDIPGRIHLFLKICEAVTYAHRKLVVHRDLKPGNILIAADGTPKLLDFGIAKLLTEDGSNRAHTIAGLGLTPDYASPEQVLEEPITTAADVYSLGAILYLLLTGTKPHRFQTYTAREIREVICETDPPKLTEAAPNMRAELQGDLEAIVSMAMRKEPERRYPSVEQLSADLLRYLNGWPVSARPDTFRYRAGKYLRRNKTVIAAGVLIAGALAAGTAVATFEAIQASRAQSVAEKDRERAVASQQDALHQASEASRQSAIAETERREADVQRAAADTQKHVAERRFEQVHQLSGKFLLDFHEAIAKLPGATPARKMVVQTGLEYYDTLVKEAGNNRVLLEEIADGYDRLGDVQGNPYFANLGDMNGALSSYRKALAIREKISDPSPAFWRNRILGSVKLSQVTAAQSDMKTAEQYLKDAFALGQKNPAADSYVVRDALARAYGTLGDLKMREGAQGEAIEPLSKLLAMETQLALEAKDPRDAQSGISLAHTKLGDVLSRMERNSEALVHLHQALEIDRRLSAAEPNNVPLMRRVYITYYMLGRALRGRLGQSLAAPGEVQGYLEQSSAIADKMAAADPDNRSALGDVAAAKMALGEWLRVNKHPQESIAPFTQAVVAAEHSSGNEDLLVQAHQRLAVGLSDVGRYDEAFQHLAKAREYLAQSEKRNPGLSRDATRLAEILRAKADTYVAQLRWNEAAPAFQELIAIFESQWKRDPKNEIFLNERPRLYAGLAECYAATSQWDSAVSTIGIALERFREIELRRPLAQTEQEERSDATAKLAKWSASR